MTSGPELLGTEKEKRAPVPVAERAERAGRGQSSCCSGPGAVGRREREGKRQPGRPAGEWASGSRPDQREESSGPGRKGKGNRPSD